MIFVGDNLLNKLQEPTLIERLFLQFVRHESSIFGLKRFVCAKIQQVYASE